MNPDRLVYEWLCRMPGVTCSLSRQAVVFVTDRLEAVVRFWPEQIAEFTIHDALEDRKVFWNHTASNDLPELLRCLSAFFQAFHGESPRPAAPPSVPALAVRIVCTTGLSSGMAALLLSEEAGRQELDWTIDSGDLSSIQPGEVVLLAPQMASAVCKVKDHPAGVIPALDYGQMNAPAMLALAEKVWLDFSSR